jgi:hypothetical protein
MRKITKEPKPPLCYCGLISNADVHALSGKTFDEQGFVAWELQLIRNYGGVKKCGSVAELTLLHRSEGLSDDQLFAIISAPGIALRGWNAPPDKQWLLEDQPANRPPALQLSSAEACSIIYAVEKLFHFSSLAPAFIPSKERIDHARRILHASRKLLAQLRDAQTDDLPWHDEVKTAHISQAAEIIDHYEWLEARLQSRREWQRRVKKDESLLDRFIRGPLAKCFYELTGRKATGGWKTSQSTPGDKNVADAAFVRFAVTFFDQVQYRPKGRPVAGSTVHRALYRGRGRNKAGRRQVGQLPQE